MAKTLIKIAVSLLVLHAAFRVGNAYWNYYRFVDALQQSAQFGERRSDKQLCEEAMGSATQYDIPIAAASLTIFRGQSAPYNCDGGGPGTASAATTQPSTQIRIEGLVHGAAADPARLQLPVGVQAGREGLAQDVTRRPALMTPRIAGAPTRIRSTASPSTMTASIRLPVSRLPTSASLPIA